MEKEKQRDDIERAEDEKTSQRLHLDWWAFIVAAAVGLILLIWHWAGGTPSIPFKDVLDGLLPK